MSYPKTPEELEFFPDSPTVSPERKAQVLEWVASFDEVMAQERVAWEDCMHARSPEEFFELASKIHPRDKLALFEGLAIEAMEPFQDSWFLMLSKLPFPLATAAIAEHDLECAEAFALSYTSRESLLAHFGMRNAPRLVATVPNPKALEASRDERTKTPTRPQSLWRRTLGRALGAAARVLTGEE